MDQDGRYTAAARAFGAAIERGSAMLLSLARNALVGDGDGVSRVSWYLRLDRRVVRNLQKAIDGLDKLSGEKE